MPKPAVLAAAAATGLRPNQQRELPATEPLATGAGVWGWPAGGGGEAGTAGVRRTNSIQTAIEARYHRGDTLDSGQAEPHVPHPQSAIGGSVTFSSSEANPPAQRKTAKAVPATCSDLVLPEHADRVLESEMEKFLGAWKHRKVVLTLNAVYFAKTDPQGEDKCLDMIRISDIWMLDDREYDAASATSRVLWPSRHNPLPAPDQSCIIQLETRATEEHCGRTYMLRAKNPEEREQWVSSMSDCIERAQKSAKMRNRFLLIQSVCRKFLRKTLVRWFFALCIMASFICDAIEMQYLPLGRGESQMGRTFFIMELIFTILFAVELLVNMTAHWFFEFWGDSWSLFDTVVVFASIVSVATDGTNIKSIRMVRVLRALRVVSQFKSLRKIVRALTHAIAPVLSAMLVAVIVIAVYAILGVGFYAERSPILFGDFGRAVWTLVTAATMENWVTYAVDLMGGDPGELDAGVILFFVTYIVIVAYVLTSVVVAVLLENFTEASQNEHEIEIEIEESEGLKEHHKLGAFPLDALMAELVQVDTHNELVMQVDELFALMDVDGSGELSFHEIQLGLQALDVRPRIHVSMDDFLDITDGGR